MSLPRSLERSPLLLPAGPVARRRRSWPSSVRGSFVVSLVDFLRTVDAVIAAGRTTTDGRSGQVRKREA